MPDFGNLSRTRLETCHPELQRLFQVVVSEFDCSISEGERSKETQDTLFREGKSQLQYPHSLHNPDNPRNQKDGDPLGVRAVDVTPYPFEPEDWIDTRKFYVMAGHVYRVAAELGIKVRWGGDWDGNGEFRDQSFHDLPHWELIG